MARVYYTCIVCGRKFPHGQGIVMSKAGYTMHFHSRDCAYRFMKLLLERLDDSCVQGPLRELINEMEKALEEKKKKTVKVI
ncbi:MAG: hypothetical protein F7C81_03975 [Desulfurococcales archaeon]|nr:hypothetical protein [Desulfurococcales archaeon]